MHVWVCDKMHAIELLYVGVTRSMSELLLTAPPTGLSLQEEQKERIESSKNKPVPHLDEKLKAEITQAAK